VEKIVHWICISINPYFLQNQGQEELGDLFLEIFGNDYIEHYLIDYDEFEKNFDIDRYVFLRCREYESHINDLRSNRNIKNILNSFSDVVTIPEEEVLETKISTSNIIYDDIYCVNRTGFFVFGDIVGILRGSLSSLNGIVLCRSKANPEFYTVYFRLFVHNFCKQIHYSNMEFDTSIFKYIKMPVQKGQLTKGQKRINKIVRAYDSLVKENEQKRMVDVKEDRTILRYDEDEIDVANLISTKGIK
jgi:hypothetical protein